MVKFTATLLALSAAATLVLGYSEDACYYTHSDKGRCVYKCNDKACNKYGTWNRDRFHHDMTGKGYHCNKNGYDSVSCWKPHDSGDCRSHNWSCSYNKKNHHKRGYDEHEKDWDKDHHDKDWDNHHHGKDWDKDHHDKDWDNHHHDKDWDNHHHGKDWDNHHHGKDWDNHHHGKDWDHGKDHHKRGYDEHGKDWDKHHHDKDWDNHHHGKDWDNHHHGKDWDNHHHGKDWDHGKDYGKEHH